MLIAQFMLLLRLRGITLEGLIYKTSHQFVQIGESCRALQGNSNDRLGLSKFMEVKLRGRSLVEWARILTSRWFASVLAIGGNEIFLMFLVLGFSSFAG